MSGYVTAVEHMIRTRFSDKFGDGQKVKKTRTRLSDICYSGSPLSCYELTQSFHLAKL